MYFVLDHIQYVVLTSRENVLIFRKRGRCSQTCTLSSRREGLFLEIRQIQRSGVLAIRKRVGMSKHFLTSSPETWTTFHCEEVNLARGQQEFAEPMHFFAESETNQLESRSPHSLSLLQTILLRVFLLPVPLCPFKRQNLKIFGFFTDTSKFYSLGNKAYT